jgi:hypothetical protein
MSGFFDGDINWNARGRRGSWKISARDPGKVGKAKRNSEEALRGALHSRPDNLITITWWTRFRVQTKPCVLAPSLPRFSPAVAMTFWSSVKSTSNLIDSKARSFYAFDLQTILVWVKEVFRCRFWFVTVSFGSVGNEIDGRQWLWFNLKR